MIRLLEALLLTVVVEAGITFFLAPKAQRRSVVVDGVFINLLTNPLANLLWNGTLPYFFALEAGVVIVEALLYRRVSGLPWSRAAVLSLVANGVTASLSFVF